MFLLVLFIALAIGVSFLCSIMEAVVLSVTPAYIGALEERDPATAVRLQRMKESIDRPLAAILSLNTVAHTVGAAGAGAQAAVVFGNAAVGLFSAALTLGILVLSEIIPKTLGAVYWRSLSRPVSVLVNPLILTVYPLVVLSKWITRLIARGRGENSVSRAELVAMAEIGAREGVFEKQETRRLKNLLRFDGLRVVDVMTPRTVLVSFPENTTVEEVRRRHVRVSRLPIYDANRDDMSGYVLKSDVVNAVARGNPDLPLRDLKRELLTVSEGLPLSRLLDRLISRREHIALVVDEYGGTQGIVTMEDIVETMLGLEIIDEADRTVDMQKLALERWAERARRLGISPSGDERNRNR